MALLTREAILTADDLPLETVAVPEWGGEVMVRGLSGRERDGFEESIMTGKGKNRDVVLANIRAKLTARSVVDAEGKRVFRDEDIAILGEKSAAALQRVFDVASRLSGLSPEDVEELAGK